MTKIVTLIGDLGGGKTTLGAFFAKIVWWQYNRGVEPPAVPIVSNVKIEHAIRVGDIHQFLAIKLRENDKKYAFLIDDEAAQAGLESRGSGSKASAVESRIITLARKAHVDLILITQLKSMLDKRAQWLENNSILCEAYFAPNNLTGTPDAFDYTIYNSKLEEINDFSLPTEYCKRYIWPQMDTDDIPFKESLDRQFSEYYSITPDAKNRFDKIMGYGSADGSEETQPQTKEWFARKAFKPTEVIRLERSRWEILDRWWDATEEEYGYLLREIP